MPTAKSTCRSFNWTKAELGLLGLCRGVEVALVEMNWKPAERQLRQFACLCVPLLPLIAWLWSASIWGITITATIGVLLGVVGNIRPRWVQPVFLGLTLITIPLGVVVGELALLSIYAGVFVPLAILFRLRGRDRLRVRVGEGAESVDPESFWQRKSPPKSLRSYYRQS